MGRRQGIRDAARAVRERAAAARAFRRAAVAFAVLRDNGRRAVYDEHGRVLLRIIATT